MIVGSTSFHKMTGPSVLNVTRECHASWNKTGDGNPADFAGNEFLDSPIVFANGTVVALVHTEYPGGSYNNCSTGASYPLCWTVTIGLAISHDWGDTWSHAREPPNHLVAAVPYQYSETQLAYGWGDPSNIVKSPKDGFYYAAIWNRHQVGLQAPGICMIRTRDLMDPSSWRGWNGKKQSYSVSFVSPYTMGPGADPADHVCTVTNLPAGDIHTGCQAAGIAWSTYLSKFVTTLGCLDGSFKFATSEDPDLQEWSTPEVFYTKSDMPANVSIQVRALNYPTLMDPTAPTAFDDPNFYTIGQYPYLFWASIGDSPYHYGRHQWATPLKFSKH
jgi:hypothetical protein